MGTTLAAQRAGIAHVCSRLYQRGLIAGQDGNVSVRLPRGRILVTPAGLSKVDVRAQDMVELDLSGTKVRGRRDATSEVLVHLAAYAARPDVMSVVHAHPPTATGFAVAGIPLDYDALAEVVYNVGPVPTVPYLMPGTSALAERVAAELMTCDVVLLANHGAISVGPSLTVAHQRMESLEQAARILLAAHQLGGVTRLSPEDVQALERRRPSRRPPGG